MRYEWINGKGQTLYVLRGGDGLIETTAGPDDLDAQEELLRLAERVEELENRLADAVQPGEIMTALELGAENDRLDLENRALKADAAHDEEETADLLDRIAALEAEEERISILEEENRRLRQGIILAVAGRIAVEQLGDLLEGTLAVHARIDALAEPVLDRQISAMGKKITDLEAVALTGATYINLLEQENADLLADRFPEVASRIQALAEENQRLQAVIARKGDIRDALPVLNQRITEHELFVRALVEKARALEARDAGWRDRAFAKPPLCDCGLPATCCGAYEGAETPQYACDECCGHGNEDGWCITLEEIPATLQRLRGAPVEPIVATAIKAGEGAERQRIVEYLRELQIVPALTMRPEELADQIASGKKLKPSKILQEEAALCAHPDMIETQEGPLDV